MTNLRDEIARMLWSADQDSIEMPFEDIPCSPLLDNLYDLADQLLSIPEIAEALDGHRARNATYLAAKGHRISTETSLDPRTSAGAPILGAPGGEG